MKNPQKDLKGFTLIEVIMAIVIISIISVLAGMGLVQISNGYVFARKNAVAAQQAQIALTRLTKEFSAIQSVSSATASSITYARAGSSHTITWTAANQPITLDGDILIDKVQNFRLTYYNYNTTYSGAAASYSTATYLVEMTITINVYADTPLTFVDRVAI